MKKIFTLVCMAFVAMGVNAQEVWKASDLTFTTDPDLNKPVLDGMTISDNNGASYVIPQEVKQFDEGTFPDNVNRVTEWLAAQADPSLYAKALKEYTFTASTEHVTLKAVSTPNADKTAADAWQFAGAEDNKELSAEGYPTFKGYVKANTGNPSIGYYDYYDTNSDGDPVHRVSDVIWQDGSTFLPAKGCYYEFTCSEDGPLTVAMWVNKNLANNALFIIDESTGGSGNSYKRVPASDLTIKGFRNNNGWETNPETGDPATPGQVFTFTMDDNGIFQTSTESGQTNMNQPLFAYITWTAKKDVTYMVMCPKNQPGLLGFQFGNSTGIFNIATSEEDTNAPIYNLSGQRVTKETKGVLIQNGRKFVNK
jgi:hypothetical protein